jgi:hypothetical protein
MKDISQFMRVGVDYYMLSQQPLNSGDSINIITKWSKQTIIDDFGKAALKKIKKYEGFCILPSNTNYKKEINNYYNRYEQLSYKIETNGNYETIVFFLKHIFGEQYEIGLDYLTILWQHPAQILPILCLVSSERNTGKTTFLNLLKFIFEGNMTINKNEDFRGRFNNDWASKIIIAIDEVLLDRREDSERIKNLSTSKHYKSEGKGVDKVEIEFFGKFILCSNNEENFIKTDENEIRYWVRKIFPFETENPNLLGMMKKEIPAFAGFLTNREITTKSTTRMWFSKEQIQTDALGILLKGNKSFIEKEIEEFIAELFETLGVDELQYSTSDLIEELNKANIRVAKSYVGKILRERFKLEPKNSSYYLYRHEAVTYDNGDSLSNAIQKKGRFYTFKKADFIKNVDMLTNDEISNKING